MHSSGNPRATPAPSLLTDMAPPATGTDAATAGTSHGGLHPARAFNGLWPAALAMVCAVLVAVPVLGVLASFLEPTASMATLRHLADTVLMATLGETLVLALLVAVGVAVLGTTSAWLIVACEFPGRRLFEWALVLPLAMPAYIVAFAYTDLLQYAGPVQSALRGLTGWQRADYAFPEIRSLPGAALVFALVLYPYVYLLARTALQARTATMVDAARSLGLSAWSAGLRVNLPLARPAVVAGTLLALMETVADYGAVSYFGLQTFTAAIYRAWFSFGDPRAASQLAAMLLVLVLLALLAEVRARGRARFYISQGSARTAPRTLLRGGRAAAACLACCIPVGLGFLGPLLILTARAWPARAGVPWARYADWLGNSLLLAGGTALLVLVLVLGVAYTARLAAAGWRARMVQAASRLMVLGYAVPGAVLAVGMLGPLTAADRELIAVTQWLLPASATTLATGPAVGGALLLTGSLFALLYACTVRSFAAAWQPVEAGLVRITPAMDASARSLGASGTETFFRVHLPLLRSSIAAGGLLVFVDVMKELPATLVLRPFDFDTLAVVTYQFAADERLTEAAAPALAIVAVGILPVLLLSRVIGRTRR